MKRIATCLLILCVIATAGCGSSGLPRQAWADAQNLPSTESRTAVDEPAARTPTSRQAVSADYKLAPRDQVVFEMFNEVDLKTTQRLSTTGEMTLPLIGTVPLAGKSLREAEQFVRQLYIDGGYYVDPQVILSVAEYNMRFVQVLGQVNRPSSIEMPIEQDTMGLVEAITQAGGFTRVARTDSVQVRRRQPDGTDKHFTVDVRDFLNRRGSRGEEFQLQPGDVVFVRERLI